MQQLPPTTVLVFVEEELRRGNPMLQLIQPMATVQEFARLKPKEATEWLRGEVRRRGLHMTRNAAQTLVDRAGGDRGALTQAVDKLALYAGDANVDETIVEAMVPAMRSANQSSISSMRSPSVGLPTRCARSMTVFERIFRLPETNKESYEMIGANVPANRDCEGGA